jgi:hypothetical protein
MITIEQRIRALDKLRVSIEDQLRLYKPEAANNLYSLIMQQQNANAWLTEEFTLLTLYSLVQKLSLVSTGTAFRNIVPVAQPGDIGVITNDKTPLSGFIECICAVLCGQRIWFKDVDSRYILLKAVWETNPELSGLIRFTPEFPKTPDAWVIHSDPKANHDTLINYFKQKKTLFLPHSIHCGIITGKETKSDLDRLADYVFTYWGFSPDNIRKLFVPKGYSFNGLFEAFEKYNYLYHHNRYANNYDYHKSIFLMDSKPFLDNGFVMVFETAATNIPIGGVGYETYETPGGLETRLKDLRQRDTSVLLRYSLIESIPKFGEDKGNYSNTHIFPGLIAFFSGR